MRSYTMLVFTPEGIAEARQFSMFTDTQSAIKALLEEYPNAVALMDRMDGHIYWEKKQVPKSITVDLTDLSFDEVK